MSGFLSRHTSWHWRWTMFCWSSVSGHVGCHFWQPPLMADRSQHDPINVSHMPPGQRETSQHWWLTVALWCWLVSAMSEWANISRNVMSQHNQILLAIKVTRHPLMESNKRQNIYFLLFSVCVLWKEDNDWLKKCMEYEVEASRPRGRPKRTWLEVVRKDCEAHQLSIDGAVDRGRWRKLIKDDWWAGKVWVGEWIFW